MEYDLDLEARRPVIEQRWLGLRSQEPFHNILELAGLRSFDWLMKIEKSGIILMVLIY